MQSLDDAIAFRLRRLDSPCPDCAPARKCEDHAWDAGLVASYQERHGSVLQEVCAGLDPGEVDRAMRAGDGTPPTVLVLSVIMQARLRELAADGPIVVDVGDGPVVMELDGDRLAEYPLTPRDDIDGIP